MMIALRKIIHVDMDAFYASVEQRDQPELKGRPVIVGGSPEGRGVVAAASYEARKFGVHSAMPCARAKRLCPHAIFVPPHFEKYSAVSRQVFAIFREVTELVEGLSLDEAFLDVTTNNLQEPLAGKVARWIKDRIQQDTQLTASAGVGPCKLVAKLASDFRKPDGLVIVPPEKVEDFLRPMAVDKLWGVGPKTAERLAEIGIRTVEDVRESSAAQLEELLGKYGPYLYELAHGRDDRQVQNDRIAKSHGSETTLDRDTKDRAHVETLIDELSEQIAGTLGRTVTIKIRYDDFTTITRSRTVKSPIRDARRIAHVAKQLLDETAAGIRPIRLVGVSIGNLVQDGEPYQLELELMDTRDPRR
jgi:DNA polymerase IV